MKTAIANDNDILFRWDMFDRIAWTALGPIGLYPGGFIYVADMHKYDLSTLRNRMVK
jgi:hypothetical protein